MKYSSVIILVAVMMPTLAQAMASANATAHAGQARAEASAQADHGYTSACSFSACETHSETTTWSAAHTSRSTASASVTADDDHMRSTAATQRPSGDTGIRNNELSRVRTSDATTTITTPSHDANKTTQAWPEHRNDDLPAVVAQAMQEESGPALNELKTAQHDSARRERIIIFLLAVNAALLLGLLALQLRGPRLISSQRF